MWRLSVDAETRTKRDWNPTSAHHRARIEFHRIQTEAIEERWMDSNLPQIAEFQITRAVL